MNKILLTAIALPLVLGACSNVKKTLGMERNTPDEFSVVERAPLTVPPNFDLMPPQPGAPSPQEGSTAATAQDLILGSQQAAPAASTGSAAEGALVSQANRNASAPVKATGTDSSVAEKLGLETDKGTALNASEEAQRLKQQNINTSMPPVSPVVSPVMKNVQ